MWISFLQADMLSVSCWVPFLLYNNKFIATKSADLFPCHIFVSIGSHNNIMIDDIILSSGSNNNIMMSPFFCILLIVYKHITIQVQTLCKFSNLMRTGAFSVVWPHSMNSILIIWSTCYPKKVVLILNKVLVSRQRAVCDYTAL